MSLLTLARSAFASSASHEQPSRHWRIRLPAGESLDVIYSADMTPQDVKASYPNAAAVEPVQATSRRVIAPEIAELRAVVATVFSDPCEQEEALTAAMADPEPALTSLRLLARLRFGKAVGS